ncbi:MAG: TetR/AcrR family transcriptional regulator [Desulfomonile tiedjei]|nr:TetR/AcrR family transcriptional regulator [Desulfomonile tiedjei]
MQPHKTHNDAKKEKEAAIFDAACRVIREKGYHQARITDIAQAAGISYGLVYHYFKSKADLFDAILTEWWSGLFTMMDQYQTQPPSLEEQLAAIVGYFLDQYEKRPDLVHIFITEISRSSAALTQERVQMFRVFMGNTEKIIAWGQTQKILRSDIKPRYLTYIFLGALESFISIMVLEGRPLKGRSEKQRIATALLEVFLKGARASQEGK